MNMETRIDLGLVETERIEKIIDEKFEEKAEELLNMYERALDEHYDLHRKSENFNYFCCLLAIGVAFVSVVLFLWFLGSFYGWWY